MQDITEAVRDRVRVRVRVRVRDRVRVRVRVKDRVSVRVRVVVRVRRTVGVADLGSGGPESDSQGPGQKQGLHLDLLTASCN